MALDVSRVAPAGCRRLAAELLWDPERISSGPDRPGPVLVVCFPGGGMTRGYFDLAVPGYSMATHLTALGHLVALVDHPGVGDSDVPDDAWELTPEAVADADAAAVAALLQELGSGAVPGCGGIEPNAVVGLGHSAGAHVVIHQQARHAPYDALALLGWAGHGLPEYLDEQDLAVAALLGDGAPAEVAAGALVEGAHRRHDQPIAELRRGSSKLLVATEMPLDVHEAIVDVRWPLLAVVGYSSMLPGSSARAAAAVDVPVFLGVGDHDIARDAHAIPASFPASGDVTLYVLAGAGHNHNVEPTRRLLWDRLGTWIEGVATRRAPRTAGARAMYAAADNPPEQDQTTE